MRPRDIGLRKRVREYACTCGVTMASSFGVFALLHSIASLHRSQPLTLARHTPTLSHSIPVKVIKEMRYRGKLTLN